MLKILWKYGLCLMGLAAIIVGINFARSANAGHDLKGAGLDYVALTHTVEIIQVLCGCGLSLLGLILLHLGITYSLKD